MTAVDKARTFSHRDEEMYNCTSALQTLVKSDSKPLSSFGCCCRGRGGVGSRLEETGPYLPSDTDAGENV